MPRSLSRSPSYRRRRSPSPVRYRRSRRDRSRSPYSYSLTEQWIAIPTMVVGATCICKYITSPTTPNRSTP